jgi:DNA-binding MarR family transcriptional regulator
MLDHVLTDPPLAAPTDAVAVAGRLRQTVFRMARLLRQQDDSGHAPALLTALAVVDREGPLTLGALAAQEQVSPPTITKVVDTLEQRGFVARIRDEHDRRVWRVKATTRGKRALESSRNRRTEWLATQLRGVSDQDRARIMAALDVLEQFTAVPPREAP